MKESAIVRQILDGLAAEHIFAFRLNTSATKIGNRFFRSHSLGPGAADILAFPRNFSPSFHISPLWIEVKTETGKQTVAQKWFQEDVERLGHKYVIARSFDDVRALWSERVQGVGGK